MLMPHTGQEVVVSFYDSAERSLRVYIGTIKMDGKDAYFVYPHNKNEVLVTEILKQPHAQVVNFEDFRPMGIESFMS